MDFFVDWFRDLSALGVLAIGGILLVMFLGKLATGESWLKKRKKRRKKKNTGKDQVSGEEVSNNESTDSDSKIQVPNL